MNRQILVSDIKRLRKLGCSIEQPLDRDDAVVCKIVMPALPPRDTKWNEIFLAVLESIRHYECDAEA